MRNEFGYRPDPLIAPDVIPSPPGKTPGGEPTSLMMDIVGHHVDLAVQSLDEQHPLKLLARMKALEARVRKLEESK